jgi:mono/diheme cytochrome c family protein
VLRLLAEFVIPIESEKGPNTLIGPRDCSAACTLAQFRDAQGQSWLFLTGSSKTGADYSINVPPGLARVRLVTRAGQPAFLRLDRVDMTQTLQNPGSPVVTSHGANGGIVWVLDPNAPRSMNLFQPDAPHAMLYAFDALTLRLLWKSRDELFPTGKYNEPTVVDGMVLVGTDRLQAFGLRFGRQHASIAAPIAPKPNGPASGKALYETYCSACHAKAANGAPAAAALARLPQVQIVAALTSGKMAPMASGLTGAQIEAIARFLTTGS